MVVTRSHKIFGSIDYPDMVVGVDVVEALHDRINLLAKVNATEDGYQLVIHMVMTDKKTDCVSSHNEFTIRHTALFLITAYGKVLDKLRVGVCVDWICAMKPR